MEKYSIAIDGPSGAGKSTIARMTADHFGLIYVDTGAIYRTVGLDAYKKGIPSKDAKGVESLLRDIRIDMDYDSSGIQRMYLNGDDVSDLIRLPPVSIYASDVSAMPAVRAFLLDMQRSMAREHNVIMDGRDIGTVVLPDAGLKIFLTASADERARRRFLELTERGVETTFEEVLNDINYRDKNDSTRAQAPLRPADDAEIVDTTTTDLSASFDIVKALVRDRIGL